MSKPVYLDHAAATPINADVLAAMQPYFAEKFYNPSALYLSAKSAHQDLEAARASVARQIGARPAEIVFTAGGSEANNLAIHGIMRQFPEAEVVVSAIEHDAICQPAGSYRRKTAPVDKKGRIDLAALKKSITDKTVLVSIIYANNEVGVVQSLREIAQVIKSKVESRKLKGNTLPLYLHTDAAQAGNYLDISVSKLGVDLMSLNGGKIYGPKQSGCLYVRAGIQLTPIVDGGGQEWGLRSGTESLAASVGFAAALARVQKRRKAEAVRVADLRDKLWAGIQAIDNSAERSGDPRSCLPNLLHVRFPNRDNERLVMELDELGVMAATGSACKASSDEPSRTLLAMGLSAEDAGETVRFALGELNDEAGIDSALKALAKILK